MWIRTNLVKWLAQLMQPATLAAVVAAFFAWYAYDQSQEIARQNLKAIQYNVVVDDQWNLTLQATEGGQRAPDKVVVTPVYQDPNNASHLEWGSERVLALPNRQTVDGVDMFTFSKMDEILCSYISAKEKCKKMDIVRVQLVYKIGNVKTSRIVRRGT